MPRLQRLQQRLRRVFFRLAHRPATEMIWLRKMSVVCRAQRKLAAVLQKAIEMPKSFGAIRADLAAVVIDLDRMGGVDAARVIQRQTAPFGVSDGNESPCITATLRQFRACLHSINRREMRRLGRRKIDRQTDGEDVPQFSVLHRTGMDPGAKDRGEVVGQRDEIVSFVAVAAADLLWRPNAIRAVRMRVQIAAPKAAGGR